MKASKEEGGTRYSPGDKTVPGCQSFKVNLVTGSKKSSGAGEKWDWRKTPGAGSLAVRCRLSTQGPVENGQTADLYYSTP